MSCWLTVTFVLPPSSQHLGSRGKLELTIIPLYFNYTSHQSLGTLRDALEGIYRDPSQGICTKGPLKGLG